MESSRISTKSLALSYAGFFLGAGYLSGQELWQYFGAYGSRGFIGFGINAVMLAVFAIMLFTITGKTGITEFEKVIVRADRPFIRKTYAFSVMLFSYCVIIIMAAGSGALLEQVFGLPNAIGSGILCIIVAAVSMKGIDGMISAFDLLVPVLTVLTLLISFIAVIKNNGAPISFVPAEETNPLAGNWLTSTIVYLSYNLFGSVCIFVPIADRLDSATANKGSVLGSIILMFIAVSVLVAMAIYPDAPYAQLPMLSVASSISVILGYLCSIPLLCGMFGTSISSLVAVMNYGEQNWSIFKSNRLLVTAILAILAWVFSLFGFSTLVGTVYPVFGYIGIATMVLLTEHYIHIKKADKITTAK